MNFDLRDNQFMLARRQFTGRKPAVEDGVHCDLSLVIGMEAWHVMFLGISKEHPNEKPIKHGNRWHAVFSLPAPSLAKRLRASTGQLSSHVDETLPPPDLPGRTAFAQWGEAKVGADFTSQQT